MPRHAQEWKKNQKTEQQFNDEIYILLDSALNPYLTDPVHARYNDARLVTREILDNVYKHDDKAIMVGVILDINQAHQLQIDIYHDGKDFNPFADDSGCDLLKSLNYEYKFNSKFVATDSGRQKMILKLDLSPIKNG